jgi:hypothetical protein
MRFLTSERAYTVIQGQIGYMCEVVIKAVEGVVFNSDDPQNAMKTALDRVTPLLPKSWPALEPS